MQKPSAPHNEELRLRTLKELDLLDTAPEERFDRVTRLARRVFSVPIVLVSLVDADRQWFKSRQGIDATETPRDISFCGHAILDDQTLVVSDARADERFVDNPLVTESPQIRFYAGRPLSAPNGCRLGTLCLIDNRPRELTEDDRQLLGDLAGMVEDEFAARYVATVDPLTGITNRRGLEAIGNKALRLCQRAQKPASLLFLDMDGLKHINDEHGHDEGDRALQDFAGLLTETFRESDVVARIGGDEFVVFLSAARAAETEAAIERLEKNLENHNAHAGREYSLCFSVGAVAYDPAQHRSLDDLMREADERMYDDKRSKTHCDREGIEARGPG